jgi:hypothetical protein
MPDASVFRAGVAFAMLGLALLAPAARADGPTASVAAATVSRTAPDLTSVVLKPGDTHVPPNYVLSSQTSEGRAFTLTVRSWYEPQHYITTAIVPQPSNADALDVLRTLSQRYPKSIMVLGQLGTGFQNDGTAGVGEESTLLQARDRLIIMWVSNSYLVEVDDATDHGFGLAVARAQDVDSKLQGLLGS